jgi:Ni,Fe-hydrogenase I small subunit
MDFAQLQQSLATWPDNPAVIWYPAISYCSTPALLERGVTLCAAVNEVLDVQFLDHSWGHPAWPTFPDRLEARAQLEALSANPPIPICWFGCAPLPDGGEFCYWADEQAHEAMDQLVGYSEVIFAPGSLRAIEGAQNITANLAENDGAWK